MYKVKREFTDLLKENHKYNVGDAYEEQNPTWTQHLLKTGRIEKVEIKKNEVVQEKQK